MSDYFNISNITIIDSTSGKSESVDLEDSDSEIQSIDDENVSLLRHSNTSSLSRKSENDEFWGLILM
ncbi:hypothetical protein PIROE2DRAFT_16837, partial [Piromyces sp. E2]